jgi:hypothetical protein
MIDHLDLAILSLVHDGVMTCMQLLQQGGARAAATGKWVNFVKLKNYRILLLKK